MRVQKLALAVGLVSALGGNGALALGLGEIKLNSTLNQPLNAEIRLLQTRGLGDSEIKVRLASAEDFDRAGVDRAYLLSELQFDVDYSGAEPVVRISSRSPIREPFLNFLVETRWPSGRLLREYTLLMDLPAFSTNTASQPVRAAERERQQVRRQAPVQQPRQPAVQRRAPEPVQAPAEAPATEYSEPQTANTAPAQPEVQQPVYEAPAESTADSGSRVYGPVEANNTLWEIARDSRESREVSVQQTMLAIQRLNPEAFINNNINLLKKGAVLRLPTTEEVRALTMSEAVSEVASQNDAWRERVGDSALGAPLDGRAVAEESAESEVVEGRVTLGAPGDNESVTSGTGSGASESEALAGELAVSEEELDKSRLENAELQERIGELDEQIDTMERMVEVSNDELRAVQDAAAQTDAAESDTASDPLAEEAGETVETDSTGSAMEEGADAAVVDDAVTDAAPEEEAAEPEAVTETPADDDARNRVVVVQTQSEPTLVERLMENIQFIAIGAGALLVGLFGFLTWRRRKEEEEAIRQVEAEMAAEAASAEADEMSAQDDQLSAVEELESDSSFDLDHLGDLETGDPVAEAEIHLSLGQYPEAEAKLLSGLESAPANVDARLMLLEVYAQQQNVENFDNHYRQLLGYSDGPVADRAARLRETIAGAGEFEAPEMDVSSESLEAAQLDDLGTDFSEDFASNASFDDLDEFSTGATSDTASGDSSDDFGAFDDLSLDLDDEPQQSAEADGEDFSLDLDLDGDFDLGGDELQGVEGAEEPAAQVEAGDSELDLGNLDMDDFGSELSESESAGEVSSADGDLGGLEFDLDLSPAEESEELTLDTEDSVAASDSASGSELSLDDDGFDSIGDDLGDLDLDSIDLGDLELGDDLAAGGVSGSADVAQTSEAEADLDFDLAVEEEPA
ncbi:FimV/HubP family polar landmark protein, partial [uncultured Microbulbifer sp.]|uniref:FimV/HubP family polar landmark protein n=1 Tax=uncultured Microbulbifer sp. TaxID=348147 RepID=UPI0025CBFAF8